LSHQRLAKGDEPTMHAAAFSAWNKDPELTVVAQPPKPSETSGLENHVMIKIFSSSINPIDWKVHSGLLALQFPKTWPKWVGRDVSGKIVDVGGAVTKFKLGDEVFGMPEQLGGSHAEFVTCSEKSIAHKPKNLSHNEAAALPLASLTAYETMFSYGQLAAGQTTLILGGSSGVGHLAVQLAKAAGAKVITTCGPNNTDYVKSLGADQVINYRTEDLNTAVKEQVNFVFDVVGQKSSRDIGFTKLQRGGAVYTINPVDEGSKSSLPVTIAKTVFDIFWSNLYNYATNRSYYRPIFVSDGQGESLEKIARLAEEGKLKPNIDAVFPLDEVATAFKQSKEGRTRGKIVIEINKE